uniref:ferroxidase n=1 Tax=Astyanax mexicanus TaxID=7994 RepID=A0A8B9HA50_ASTMX
MCIKTFKAFPSVPCKSLWLFSWLYRGGPIYRKTVYREYDQHFKQAKTHPSWSGLLGPTLRGEEDDVITVTFRNMADHPCSIHPHGIAYGKQSEGSLYFDNTSDFEKEDDVISPGNEHTYSWEVSPDVVPKATDPPCLTYMYISHQDIVRDYNTGLIGTMLVCKKGSLSDSGDQVHFQQELVLLFGVFDENKSWYSKGGPPTKEHVKYTINGFTNGSVPDLSICAHSKVSWHLLGMSSEQELFSVHFNGHVLQQGGHKVSSVGLISGTATSAQMIAVHDGQWLLSSHISKHLEAGMHGFFTVNTCERFPAPKRQLTIQQSRESQEWTYYIAAEEVIWDYAPNMPENVDGDFRSTYLKQSSERIGKKYKKAVFTQYKDETFKERAENMQRKKEVGILGPVIRAQIRDIITIVFKNKASHPYSIYPHGLTIDKATEGANYPDGGLLYYLKFLHAVQPGETYTYVWRVIEDDEPLKNDSRCVTRMYHSAVNTPRDIASGLIGPLLICKSQSLNTRNVQLRSDKEQHAMFAVFDENKSWYLDENINTYCDPKKIKKDDPEFYKSNVMHTINGYVYESGQVLGFCNGEIVTWHVSSVGEQDGIQTATFYGHTFELNNREEDILSLFPMTGETISMNMANDGDISKYTLQMDGKGKTRTYFITAEEVEWDYAGYGQRREDKSAQNGRPTQFKKVVFREYLDSSFTTPYIRGEVDEHLGILGPVIKAEVDETIIIVFKNLASNPHSLHANGDDAVQPNETFPYIWTVNAKVGPLQSESDCRIWAYYSGVNPERDIHSGLIGPLMVCRKGTLNENSMDTRDFMLLFMTFDESKSWYYEDNLKNLQKTEKKAARDSEISNNLKFPAINGIIYSLKGLRMYTKQLVKWHLINTGSPKDFSSIHFHGQTFVSKHTRDQRQGVYPLLPGSFATLEMWPSKPGLWLLESEIGNSQQRGMQTLFLVLDNGILKLTPVITLHIILHTAIP